MEKKEEQGAEQEVQAPKKKKKKIKKVDVAQNLLFAILGIIMGLVAIIGLCAMNPDLTNVVSEILIAANEAEEANRPVSDVASNSATSYSFDPEKFRVSDDVEDSEVPSDAENAEDAEGVVDVAENADNSGVGTETTEVANTENAAENEENAGNTDSVEAEETTLLDAVEQAITPLVTISSDETTIEPVSTSDMEEFTYNPEVVYDRSSYAELDPDIIELPSQKQAEQIANTTGYGETGEDLDFNADFYPYYNMLDDNSKALYRQIYANANALNKSFRPIVQTNMKELRNVIESVTYDHPELFWLDTTFYTEYDWDGTAVKLELSFYDSLGDITPARNAFEANADKLIEGARGLSSDYEKEKYVHDILADKLNYKHNPLDQSAYSAIVGDNTVCAGYAKAFQYLMQKLGIPTYLCVGAGAFQLHGWNVTRINGNYYNVDCTWDDQDPTIYDYFNLPDSINFMHTRMFQSVNLPACDDFSFVGQ